MNKLDLSVKVVQSTDSLEINHIAFENSAIIWPRDKSDLKLFVDQGALVVPSELEKSIYSSGVYLIFTDVSGIADDGGWDYIRVTHKNNLVYWKVWFNNGWVELVFELTVYQKELIAIMNQLKLLPPNISVQPSQIIFPE